MYSKVRDKISSQTFFLSCYVFAFLFLSLYGQQGYQTLNQVILWGLGPILAFYIIEPNIGRLYKIPKEYFLYISLVFFAFLGYVNVQDNEGFFRYVQVIIANFVLMVTVYFAINNIKEWSLVWKVIWIVGLVVCVLSFFFETASADMDEYYRLEGLTGNSNGTANYARVGIIAALIILQFHEERIWKIIFWASMIFLFYIIILTASRGAFGNIIFIFGGYLIFKYFSGWRLILMLILLLYFGNIILILAEKFLNDFYLYQRLMKNDSIAGAIEDEGRLQLYLTGWKIFIESPILGVGLNQFRLFSGGLISHADFLDIFVQLGIFAGIMYVSIYVKLYNRIRKLNKWFASPRDKRMYQLILLCFISELLFGLSNPNWFTQLEMIVLSLLIVYTTKIIRT